MAIENIQEKLAREVFQHTKSPRKASDRAIGTLVEIIIFYVLITWSLRDSISVEIALPEYGHNQITHNVEYSLHPINTTQKVKIKNQETITTNYIISELKKQYRINFDQNVIVSNTILTKDNILRNSCMLDKNLMDYRYIANMLNRYEVQVTKQNTNPYMIFECKRVGRDAKQNRCPQAIEKAKQASYVANTVSSLQKVRDDKGNQMGILFDKNNNYTVKPYVELLDDLLNTDDIEKLQNFVMTVGVVSNHGNWFTSEKPNKEIMVLSQSYDWLLFLTDQGLSQFIEETILSTSDEYKNINEAFHKTYSKENKSGTQFTKTKINYGAHLDLLNYFNKNINAVESWFNIIQPKNTKINALKDQITKLKSKRWNT